MSDDNVVVQKGELASPLVEPVSTTTVEPPKGVTEPTPIVVKPVEPTAEEKMTALIAQKVAEEVTKVTEAAKRELQSVKDRGVAEVQIAQRRARLAESTLTAAKAHIQSLDPETAKEMELAELRAERKSRGDLEQEEAAHQQAQAFHNKFISNLSNYITNLGIDPQDKRIQVVGENLDYMEIQRQVLDSVARIQKENATTAEKAVEQKIKEAEIRIKKDLGFVEANSVSTTASVGASSEGIPTDMGKFREWIATLPQKEYEEKAAKIQEMMQQGKIK